MNHKEALESLKQKYEVSNVAFKLSTKGHFDIKLEEYEAIAAYINTLETKDKAHKQEIELAFSERTKELERTVERIATQLQKDKLSTIAALGAGRYHSELLAYIDGLKLPIQESEG